MRSGRRALYDAVDAARGAQAWMTGTGPELFDGLEAQRFRVSDARRGIGGGGGMSAMWPKSITLVTLGVADLARARAFYAALGWEAAQAPEGVVFIQLAGQVLALFGIDDLAADMHARRASLGIGAATLARNFATEAEVDAAFELAVSAGARGAEAAGEGRSGAATRAISPTRTATSGSWR